MNARKPRNAVTSDGVRPTSLCINRSDIGPTSMAFDSSEESQEMQGKSRGPLLQREDSRKTDGSCWVGSHEPDLNIEGNRGV